MKSRKNKVKTEVVEFSYVLQPFNTEILFVYADDILIGKRFVTERYGVDATIEPARDTKATGCYSTDIKVADPSTTYHYIIFTKKEFGVGIIIHECLHALYNITNDRGMFLSDGSEEFYTYSLQAMVVYVLEQFKNVGIDVPYTV